MSIPVLIITGPVGVGKTTIASEMSSILEDRHIPHAAIDFDALSWCYPRPPGDRFGSTIGLKNLAAIWRNFREFGAERLIIPAVIESRADLEDYRDSVPDAAITVVRLRAELGTLAARVVGRERGNGLDWHTARSAELAELFERVQVEDFAVETEGRSVPDIAHEVLIRAGWLG